MDLLKQTILAQGINISSLPHVDTSDERLRSILTFVFTLTGAIALLVITVAGFRYVISHGDSNLIAQSKNAIIYSLIGLVVSIFAVAIVQFVIGRAT